MSQINEMNHAVREAYLLELAFIISDFDFDSMEERHLFYSNLLDKAIKLWCNEDCEFVYLSQVFESYPLKRISEMLYVELKGGL